MQISSENFELIKTKNKERKVRIIITYSYLNKTKVKLV
jgi:hypothetical protein